MQNNIELMKMNWDKMSLTDTITSDKSDFDENQSISLDDKTYVVDKLPKNNDLFRKPESKKSDIANEASLRRIEFENKFKEEEIQKRLKYEEQLRRNELENKFKEEEKMRKIKLENKFRDEEVRKKLKEEEQFR